jgi:glycosyltransferase involved in cell wall biosynthesis
MASAPVSFMKIFVFTTVFAPQLGGIERLTEVLAREWAAMDHEVVVATVTPGPPGGFPFPVIRAGDYATLSKWGQWCDVHLQMNVSLKYTPLALIRGRTIVISHQTSYWEHVANHNLPARAKNWLANRIAGIACSDHIRVQIPRAVTVSNPYDQKVFQNKSEWRGRHGDLAFLGRLVSDKGCDTLLDALVKLRAAGLTPSTTIIGDGEERLKLEHLVAELGLNSQVKFKGALAPREIAETLNKQRFLIVPSRWEEPFGIVALEGLACGCVPIVSRRGGLVEAIGIHGYTFENGDASALAQVLAHALHSPDEARSKLVGAETHLSKFTARRVAERYVEVFESLIT